jgi:hypothetical protein
MKPHAWDNDVLQALAPSVARSPFGTLASAEEMLQGAHLYRYDDGAQAAFVAVRPVRFAAGQRLDIVGLRSLGDRLNTRKFIAALDDLGTQFDAHHLAFCTQVGYVAKSCLKNGYHVSGVVLLKNRMTP